MNVDNSHFTSLQPIRQRDLAWGQFINVYSCFNLDQTIRKCKYTWLHIRGNNTFVRRLLMIKRLVYIWKLECNEHELWTVVADWTEAAYERQFESDPVTRSSGGESVNGAHHLIQLLFVVDWHQMTSIVDTGVLKSTEKRRKYPSVTLHHHHLLSAVWCLFSSPLRPWSSDVVWRRRPSDSGPDPAGTSLLSPPSDTLRPDICSDSTQKELLWHRKKKSCQCCVLVFCVELSLFGSYMWHSPTWTSEPPGGRRSPRQDAWLTPWTNVDVQYAVRLKAEWNMSCIISQRPAAT